MIYLEDGTVVPVEKSELPILLPKDVDLNANGNPLMFTKPGSTPIEINWKKAIRETDTLDTFVTHLGIFTFCSPNNNSRIDEDKVKYWMPVDQYIGGIEYFLYLLYSVFY